MKIKKVRDLTGARITFPNEGDEDKERITISGRKDAVERAKEELESMIEMIVSIELLALFSVDIQWGIMMGHVFVE